MVFIGPTRRYDGRHRRSEKSKDTILKATRVLMQGGAFRPDVSMVAKASGYCQRVVFYQFGDMPSLYEEALQDKATRDSIAARVLNGLVPAVVSVAVFGRVP